MKLEEFNKMVTDVQAEQKDIYAKAKALYDSGERSLQYYKDIGAYKEVGYYTATGFLRKVQKQSDCLSDYSNIEDMIDMLQELQKEWDECIEIEKTNLQKYEDVSDEYITFFGFKYTYLMLDENKLSSEISRIIREKIKEDLKPSNVDESIMPDCKIVQLFKDGAITWEILQSITYQNCKVS